MKGIVFTELVEHVERAHGTDMADRIIERACPRSGGSYTAVGDYHHAELIALVSAMAAQTGRSAGEIQRDFGRALFARLAARKTSILPGSAFECLVQVESIIHRDVRMLYPSAELPSIVCERRGSDILVVDYASERPFADLARGLIEGCLAHYGERAEIREEEQDGARRRRFVLTRLAA